MAIIRWKPESNLWSLREDMNDLFDSFFGRALERREGIWSPAVNVTENKDAVVVTAEVPGLKKEDISISMHDNVLTLKGEKKQEKIQEDENYHCVERSFGSFNRSFTLPTMVDSAKVKASYKDGILTVELPKKEEAKPKEISINVS